MRYYAFVRALNVGKHNRIRMADLRALCESTGLANVRTYLQTGNIVFESEDDGESIATKLEVALAETGLRNASVMVRTPDELRELLASGSFSSQDETMRRFVIFFRLPLAERDAGASPEGVHVVAAREREIVFATQMGQGGPSDVKGNPGTARYWHVVEAFLAFGERE